MKYVRKSIGKMKWASDLTPFGNALSFFIFQCALWLVVVGWVPQISLSDDEEL
jgi:hypothetical protein